MFSLNFLTFISWLIVTVLLLLPYQFYNCLSYFWYWPNFQAFLFFFFGPWDTSHCMTTLLVPLPDAWPLFPETPDPLFWLSFLADDQNPIRKPDCKSTCKRFSTEFTAPLRSSKAVTLPGERKKKKKVATREFWDTGVRIPAFLKPTAQLVSC